MVLVVAVVAGSGRVASPRALLAASSYAGEEGGETCVAFVGSESNELVLVVALAIVAEVRVGQELCSCGSGGRFVCEAGGEKRECGRGE